MTYTKNRNRPNFHITDGRGSLVVVRRHHTTRLSRETHPTTLPLLMRQVTLFQEVGIPISIPVAVENERQSPYQYSPPQLGYSTHHYSPPQLQHHSVTGSQHPVGYVLLLSWADIPFILRLVLQVRATAWLQPVPRGGVFPVSTLLLLPPKSKLGWQLSLRNAHRPVLKSWPKTASNCCGLHPHQQRGL